MRWVAALWARAERLNSWAMSARGSRALIPIAPEEAFREPPQITTDSDSAAVRIVGNLFNHADLGRNLRRIGDQAGVELTISSEGRLLTRELTAKARGTPEQIERFANAARALAP